MVYTNVKLTSTKDVAKLKKYTFNTDCEDIKEGDMIKSPEYGTNLQVVKVLESSFKYYHPATGDLSNEYKSTLQWEIRTLKIIDSLDSESSIVLGERIKS